MKDNKKQSKVKKIEVKRSKDKAKWRNLNQIESKLNEVHQSGANQY